MENAKIRVVSQDCKAVGDMSELEVHKVIDEMIDCHPDLTRWESRKEVVREISDADRFYHLDEEEVELACDDLDDDELATAILVERVSNMLEDWGSPINGREHVKFDALLEETMATTHREA